MLEKINKPNDIHKIALADFPQLAEEIRQFLIESVSHTGGHLASNLGVVELTLALHNVLELPQDKIVWDVGHQAYTHKILTGRKDGFKNLRKEGGMSGFPKRSESDCDAFDAGHSSNSISAGLGYVRARDLQGQKYHVVSVIGDGALTGGMAYEALNNAAELKTNFIIVLNDNNMSISKNVGGMSSYLSALRTAEVYTGMKLGVTKTLKKVPRVGTALVDTMRKTKSGIKQLIIPGMLFENMGLTYLGPVDGHNMRQMMKLFNEAKRVEGPVIVHVLTEKGRGYEPARRHPDRFHGTGPFDISTGKQLSVKTVPTYTDVFADTMVKLGRTHPRLVGITAAMKEGTGLKKFENEFPDRLFDVGIAEETAVAMASGIAKNGGKPVFGVYSTFIQRTYDQLSQDLCINNSAATILVYWASVYGMNDVTHLGIYDIPMMSNIPNLVYLAPTTKEEYLAMLDWSIEQNDHPVAIRVPISVVSDGKKVTKDFSKLNEYEVTQNGSKIAIVALGSFYSVGAKTAEIIENKTGVKPTLINPIYITGTDDKLLEQLKENHDIVITVEDGVLDGGFGEKIARFYGNSDIKVLNYGLKKEFLDRYNPEEIVKANRLTPEQIAEDVCGIIG